MLENDTKRPGVLERGRASEISYKNSNKNDVFTIKLKCRIGREEVNSKVNFV